MRLFQRGNKAALIVGIILMIADSFVPMAHEFGAWQVGCIFCVWYSVSAIREDERISKKLRRWLYAYLAIVFVFAIALHAYIDAPPSRPHWSINSSLKAMGIEGR